jgi:hypothetical protein
MINAHSRTWNIERTLKKVKNDKCTVYDLEYGEKPEKH